MKRWHLLLAVLVLIFPVFIFAQGTTAIDKKAEKVDPQVEKDLRYARELFFRDRKPIDALPWLEKVAVELPNDASVQEDLGVCRMHVAETLPTLEERRKGRIAARQALLRAKELGDKTDLLGILLEKLPEDGADAKLSENADVDKFLKAGEAAFSAGNLDEAKKSYLRAIVSDPNNATAMLYVGDVYYNQKLYGSAIEWFHRSSAADPTREAAYRYCADALMALGRYSEAREHYINAVIANPYTKASWSGINKWSKFTGKSPTWYQIKPRGKVETGAEGSKNITITIDSSIPKDDPGGAAWLLYSMTRALWHGDQFKKEFPNEPKYRHTLKEEAAALSGAAEAVDNAKDKKSKVALSPDLEALVRLQKAGLIEPYVLFNVPDNDITQDYAEYRKQHRDLLVKYLSEIVVPPAPPDQPKEH